METHKENLKKVYIKTFSDALNHAALTRGFVDFYTMANAENTKDGIYMEAGILAQERLMIFLEHVADNYGRLTMNDKWDGTYISHSDPFTFKNIDEIYDAFIGKITELK